jgi:hypothetical protein
MQTGRQANLKEISSRKLPSYAKHTKHQKPALATTNRSEETGARDTKPSDNECTNGKTKWKKKTFESLWREREWDTKERLGEDGEDDLARSKKRYKTSTGAKSVWSCSKAVHSDNGAQRDKEASKRLERLSQKKGVCDRHCGLAI